MIKKESLKKVEKIKLLSGKSGETVAEQHGEKFPKMNDGPHGVSLHGVCYPNMCLVSSSWDKDVFLKTKLVILVTAL